MKYSIFKACFLLFTALFLHSCSFQKTTPPAGKQVTLQTPPPSTPQQQPAAPLSVAPVAPPPSGTIDISTRPGFLGKSTDPAKEAQALISDLSKKVATGTDLINRYRDLTFFVHNVSGTTLYVSCFSYLKLHRFNRWRWRKSEVKEIKPGEKISCVTRILEDPKDFGNIFGALAVFSQRQDAEAATYELLRDENKLDLDLLIDIENKTVVVGVERYGFREPFFDYDFVKDKETPTDLQTELSFFVQNQTGRPVFITGFIYSKKAKGRWIAAVEDKDDMSVWRFYKTKVLRLENGQTGFVDVDSIIPQRDRSYVRGYLGIFDEDHEKDAHNKTYELLSEQEKINLGPLTSRQGRTIILEVERYGVANDVIDFTVKPIRWIDFTKIVR